MRLGLHYGILDDTGTDAEPASGEGVTVARQLASLCENEQALVSGTAVMVTSSATRNLISAQALSGPNWARLEWPVYAIGQRTGLVTSIPAAARSVTVTSLPSAVRSWLANPVPSVAIAPACRIRS